MEDLFERYDYLIYEMSYDYGIDVGTAHEYLEQMIHSYMAFDPIVGFEYYFKTITAIVMTLFDY